ncbi:MAG: ribosome-associated translation inhibitor RaiA [Phycisphaerales bacterium]|nr:ribosome-associated translation inhibitor RaiA [Phycisphaerales bacterium]
MQVNVVGKNVQLASEIREYAQERAMKLPHYMDRVQQVDIVVGRDGSEFACEILVDVEGHKDFVANAHDLDIHACIDQAHDRAVRQLTDWKDRLRDSHQ